MRNKFHEKKKKSNRQLLFIIGFFFLLSVSYFLVDTVNATDSDNVNILYADFNEENNTPITTALGLDDTFTVEIGINNIYTATSGAELFLEFDVIFLVDPIFDSDNVTKLLEYMQAGGGIVYVFGEHQASETTQLTQFDIVKPSGVGSISNNIKKAVPTLEEDDSANVFTSIDWNSSPDYQNYTLLPKSQSDLGDDWLIDVEIKDVDAVDSSDATPLLMHKEIEDGMFIVCTGWLANDDLSSQHLWPYFNYLVYSFSTIADQTAKLGYADWEYSPVPHLIEKIIWCTIIACLVVFTIIVTRRQLKKSRKNIDQVSLAKISGETKLQLESEIETDTSVERSNAAEIDIKDVQDIAEQDGTARLMEKEEVDEWEEIGYHRQLSGFLFALFMTLFLIGPQLVLTLYVYPNYIMPYPQAAGYYSFVKRFFEAFWLFLDFGTSTAAAKFFAQYRVKQPKKAIRYIQIYIWWQFLSGIGQFAVVSMIGLFAFPYSQYAHMSWFFILHSMIQFPGFLAVFLYFFQGIQKLDTAQLLDIFKGVIFTFFFQYLMVVVCRLIFKGIPQYGEVFGAVVGLAIGSWFAEFAFFGLGYALFKKQGYKGDSLFRIDFGMDEIKETFKYGLKLVAGNVWVPLVWFLQVIMISLYVTDYSSEMAYFDLALTLSQVMSLVGLYLSGMMPPISESLGNGKKKLFDLGMVEMLRIMNWLCYCIGAILFVVGNRIIIGLSGPTWERATVYFIGLLIHAIMGPYSWSGDRVFQGTGRTDLNLYTWIMEQGIRAIGLLIFVPMMGMMGVIVSYNIALASKGIAVWILIRKKIWHGKAYLWKTFVSPAITAVLIFFILEGIARLVWQGEIISTVILTVFGIFGGIFLSALFNGYFGLWDDNTLKEFDKATKMVKTVGFLARALYKIAYFGAITLKSPFHKFSPIDLYDEAMEEARDLTKQKRVLEV